MQHFQLFLKELGQLHPNLFALVTYVKYPNLDLITNIRKGKKGKKRERDQTERKISQLKAGI